MQEEDVDGAVVVNLEVLWGTKAADSATRKAIQAIVRNILGLFAGWVL
jgi:hypothetical protein